MKILSVKSLFLVLSASTTTTHAVPTAWQNKFRGLVNGSPREAPHEGNGQVHQGRGEGGGGGPFGDDGNDNDDNDSNEMERSLATYQCAWPAGTDGFTLITKEDTQSSVKNYYTNVAVGGTFKHTDGTQNAAFGHNNIPSTLYYRSLDNDNNNVTNINADGLVPISSLADVPLTEDPNPSTIDFAHYEWLASNIQADNTNVFVIEENSNSCYDLFDFLPSTAQPDEGYKYLVVVRSAVSSICFTKTSGGNQFGPNVLAPFSEITLFGDAGYIDGTVIARSFKTDGVNDAGLQLHGDFYTGPICCTDCVSATYPVEVGRSLAMAVSMEFCVHCSYISI